MQQAQASKQLEDKGQRAWCDMMWHVTLDAWRLTLDEQSKKNQSIMKQMGHSNNSNLCVVIDWWWVVIIGCVVVHLLLLVACCLLRDALCDEILLKWLHTPYSTLRKSRPSFRTTDQENIISHQFNCLIDACSILRTTISTIIIIRSFLAKE